MLFVFTVRGDRIIPERAYDFIEGNKGSYEAWFEFSEEWKDCAKVCVVEQGEKVYEIPVINKGCFLPEMERGTARIGVIGTMVGEDENATTISTNMQTIGVLDGAAGKEANSQLNTAAEVWEKYLSDMEKNRVKAEAAAESSETARNKAQSFSIIAKNAETAAIKASNDAAAFAEGAREAATAAEEVAENAQKSVGEAQAAALAPQLRSGSL